MFEGGKQEGSGHDLAYRAPALEREPPEVPLDLRQRGKTWVAVMMGVHVVGSAVNIVELATLWGTPFSETTRQVMASQMSARIAGVVIFAGVELLLYVALHRGRQWARFMLGLMQILGLLSIATLGLTLISVFGFLDYLGLARTVWVLGMLVASPSISALVRTRQLPTLVEDDDADETEDETSGVEDVKRD